MHGLADLQRQQRRQDVDVRLDDRRGGAEGAEEQIDLLPAVDVGEAAERRWRPGERLDAAGVGEGVDRPRRRTLDSGAFCAGDARACRASVRHEHDAIAHLAPVANETHRARVQPAGQAYPSSGCASRRMMRTRPGARLAPRRGRTAGGACWRRAFLSIEERRRPGQARTRRPRRLLDRHGRPVRSQRQLISPSYLLSAPRLEFHGPGQSESQHVGIRRHGQAGSVDIGRARVARLVADHEQVDLGLLDGHRSRRGRDIGDKRRRSARRCSARPRGWSSTEICWEVPSKMEAQPAQQRRRHARIAHLLANMPIGGSPRCARWPDS